MFTNGAGDLVLHFIAQCNSQLTDILAEEHKQVQLGQSEYVYTKPHFVCILTKNFFLWLVYYLTFFQVFRTCKIFTGVCYMTMSWFTLFQTKEDCRLSQRCRGDQTEDVHPLHWVMATGRLSLSRTRCVSVVRIRTDLDLTLSPCLLVLRQWASCCSPTTSQTVWSTSPTWWTTFGTTLETDPQTWVDPTVLDPPLLPLIPSCPLFITTHAISGLPPPRLPSPIASDFYP